MPDLTPNEEPSTVEEEDATREAILALTWFPAIRDAVSGDVSPPRRKTHVRVRDIDAALARLDRP